jgi:hypothetical protein
VVPLERLLVGSITGVLPLLSPSRGVRIPVRSGLEDQEQQGYSNLDAAGQEQLQPDIT